MSLLFAQAASILAGATGSVDANLQEAVNQFALDVADDGLVSAARSEALLAAAHTLRPFWVDYLFQRRLDAIGSTASLPDLNRVLDSDGDGLVNASDECPLQAGDQGDSPTLCDYDLSFEPMLGASTADPSQGTLLAADFSGDGLTDALYVSAGEGAWLLNGTVTGGFGDRRPVVLGAAAAHALTALDLDADGRVDVVEYTDELSPPWLAHFQDASGGFSAGVDIWPASLPDYMDQCRLTPQEPWRVWGNLDGDALPDVLFRAGDYCVVALFGGTDGQLVRAGMVANTVEVSGLLDYRSVTLGIPAMADMNSDGRADVVVAEEVRFAAPPHRRSISVYVGDGEGGFARATPLQIDNEILQVAPAILDFDHDGQPDALLQVRSGNGDTLLLALRGAGNGGFAAATPLKSMGEQAVALALADLDGDGRRDVAGSQLGVLFVGAAGIVDGGALGFEVPGLSYHFSAAVPNGPRQCLLGDYVWRAGAGRREAGLVTFCL